MEPGDPVHHEHRAMRRVYGVLIDNAKKAHWEGFLASLNEKSIWTAHHYASGDPMDGGRTKIPRSEEDRPALSMALESRLK